MDATSHLQFANSTLLKGEASLREARVIKATLDKYCEVSKQRINSHKSKYYCFNTPLDKKREISRILGVKNGKLPGKFLGIPLFAGASRSSIWNKLLDNYVGRLKGWKSKWFSFVGRTLSHLCYSYLLNVTSKDSGKNHSSGQVEDEKILLEW